MRNKVTVYGCGGAGSDVINRSIEKPTAVTGQADLKLVTVDTSKSNTSNLREVVSNYVIPGSDGTGKTRIVGKELFEPYIEDFLKEHSPGDYNIVIFSAGGGTGASVGPILARELIARGKPTIVITILTYTSKVQIRNTLMTIGTINAFAKQGTIPTIITEYDSGDKKSEVEDTIGNIVNTLSVLFSGQNHGLDSNDINKFFHYEKSTSLSPGMGIVNIVVGDEVSEPVSEDVIGTCSLLSNPDSSVPHLGQLYDCDGVMPAELGFKENIHLVINNTRVSDLIKSLNARHDAVIKREEEMRAAETQVTIGASENDDGFFF